MEINIQELTENEKRQQIKEKHQSYNRRFLDYCEVFGIDPQKYMQEYYHNIAIHSDEYKKLEAENQRLKEQLDREIKINRNMKSALEKYADPFNDMQPINELAKQVLKEIGEEE